MHFVKTFEVTRFYGMNNIQRCCKSEYYFHYSKPVLSYYPNLFVNSVLNLTWAPFSFTNG